MYDTLIIAVLPIIWIALNLSSFILICIYELSHTIPALLFTNNDITVYIGSYGDNTSPKFKIGRITFYIRPKFSYLKNRGLCLYKRDLSFSRQFSILVTAPIVLIIILCLLINLTFLSDLNDYVRAGIGVVLISATINLVVNLFPKKIPVKFTERLIYSDGYELILRSENLSNYQNIITASDYYDEGDFANSLGCLTKTNDKYMDDSIFSMTLSCYVHLNNYDAVIALNEKYKSAKWNNESRAIDYSNLADAEIALRKYNDALLNLNKSIKLDPNSFHTRNNRGFVLNVLGNYEGAKEDLNNALFINDRSSAAYSYRAYSVLKLGRPGEALINIEKALSLDETNSYAYAAMGIYQFEKENFKLAAENFNKAKKIDSTIHFVDGYIIPKPKRKVLAVKKAPVAKKAVTVKQKIDPKTKAELKTTKPRKPKL